MSDKVCLNLLAADLAESSMVSLLFSMLFATAAFTFSPPPPPSLVVLSASPAAVEVVVVVIVPLKLET